MIESTLASGAKLQITPSPFETAKALWQACLEEVKDMKMDPGSEIDVNFYKSLFCAGFSSKKIEAALKECFKRVVYRDMKIDKDTFEPVENREDYLEVCFEVAKANIEPFTKSLFVKYKDILTALKAVQP